MRLVITGQVHGGKNSMGITRTGKHYPRAAFKSWRDAAIMEVRQQWRWRKAIVDPVSVVIEYWSADKRRRDIPAIIDSLWHVLERADVVLDDSLLGGAGCSVNFKNEGVAKKEPGVVIFLGDGFV